MQGIKSAEVFCQFSEDGKMIPIRFKITDEDRIRQTFHIRRYRQPSVYMKQTDSCLGRSYQTRDILDFDCKIEVLGVEKTVRLRYFVDRMEWKVLY